MGNSTLNPQLLNEAKSVNNQSCKQSAQSKLVSINNESTREQTKLNLTQLTVKENKFIKVFQWTGKAREVFLFGTFSNWQRFIRMTYDRVKKVFYCEVDLCEGVYFYKFIVDGKISIAGDQVQRIYKDGENSNFVVIKKGLSNELLMVNTAPALIPSLYEKSNESKAVGNSVVDHLLLSLSSSNASNGNEGNNLISKCKGEYKALASVTSRVRNKTLVLKYYK